MKHLYFCRHGLSQAQVDNAWGGQNDTSLTEQGHTEAHAAGAELRAQGTQIDLIIASPLSRAHDTATIIAGTIGYPADRIVTDDRFVERTFGIYDGQPRGEDDWFAHHTYQELDDVEGNETVEKLQERAARGLEYLKTLHQDNILLVGHGAYARGLLRTIKGLPYTDEFEHEDIINIIPNAKVIELI